jgi:hypothetical protein
MTKQARVCFTFDAACDAAIEMGTQIFQNFVQAVRIVKGKQPMRLSKRPHQ